MRLGTTSMTPSRSRKTASCSTSCVREAAVGAASGCLAAAAEPRGLEGDLERAFGLEGEAERGDGLVDGLGSGERLPGELERPAGTGIASRQAAYPSGGTKERDTSWNFVARILDSRHVTVKHSVFGIPVVSELSLVEREGRTESKAEGRASRS